MTFDAAQAAWTFIESSGISTLNEVHLTRLIALLERAYAAGVADERGRQWQTSTAQINQNRTPFEDIQP